MGTVIKRHHNQRMKYKTCIGTICAQQDSKGGCEKCPCNRPKSVTYRGITAERANNYHVRLIRDGKMIAHFQRDKESTLKEMQDMIDFYLAFSSV